MTLSICNSFHFLTHFVLWCLFKDIFGTNPNYFVCLITDIWSHHKSTPESNGLTNGAGSVSPGPRPSEVSDGETDVISEFKQPLNALVQTCTMLHNIVGPACIFLRQGFSQAQFVCMLKSDLLVSIFPPKNSLHLVDKPSWKLLSWPQLPSLSMVSTIILI